jgi:hypothetical protein
MAAAVLALLANQLLLSHRASGKSVEWLQAAAWAIPTLLAWCAALPITLRVAQRWPPTGPSRIPHLGIQCTSSIGIGIGLLALHVGINWILGWIPRDTAILPFEFTMTARSYGGFNLLAYWAVVAWTVTRPPTTKSDRTAGRPAAEPFVAKVGNRRVLVPVDEVNWAEAAGNYVRLHTSRRSYLVRLSLKTLAERLDSREFVRIHRSVIVRRSAVRELLPRPGGDYSVTLTDDTTVTLSRRFRARALPALTERE